MKCAVFFTVALTAVVGLALADYGYGYGGGFGGATYVPVLAGGYGGYGGGYGTGSGGFGNGGLLALIGLLFLLMFLFGSNRSGSSDNIVLLNSTLAG